MHLLSMEGKKVNEKFSRSEQTHRASNSIYLTKKGQKLMGFIFIIDELRIHQLIVLSLWKTRSDRSWSCEQADDRNKIRNHSLQSTTWLRTLQNVDDSICCREDYIPLEACPKPADFNVSESNIGSNFYYSGKCGYKAYKTSKIIYSNFK